MRWVKLTLPPRARRRWLLITTRLSKSSLAGTARTLVAVGTCSDCSMLATTRAAAPRSGVVVGAALASAGFSVVFAAAFGGAGAVLRSADGLSGGWPSAGVAAGAGRTWVVAP